jgi:hypothetical protein
MHGQGAKPAFDDHRGRPLTHRPKQYEFEPAAGAG